jgi:hypothetical protein
MGKKETKSGAKSTRGPTIEFYNSDVYEKLSLIAETRGTNVKKLSNDVLELFAEREEVLKKYLPQLTKINFLNGIMYINDSDAKQMAEVGINKKSKIYCKLCDSTECVHVVFALAQIELPRLEPIK